MIAAAHKGRTIVENTSMHVVPRPAHQFTAQHSNRWAMRIGFMLGRGIGSTDIAANLADGTHPATIRGLAKKAGLLPDVPKQVTLPVSMPYWQRDAIAAKAAEIGVEMDVLIIRILESAIVLDDLYIAVCDDRYDNDNAAVNPAYRKAGSAK